MRLLESNSTLFASIITLFFLSHIANSQNNKIQSGWTCKNSSEQKVFIENNGQIEEKYNDGAGKILFYTSQDGIHMNWSATGLTYEVTECYLSEEAKRELKKGGEGEEEARERMQEKNHFFHMEWIGSNPNPEIISEQSVSYYFTYTNPRDKSGKTGIKASAYNKITYKNIYPNIDVEYILPEKGGVKYSFIVHPGADISQIKMRYTGANKATMNLKGEIEINTISCGNYLEHQPETYYTDGTKVSSIFSLQKGVIGFRVPSYDNAKTLIIDPWVSVVSFPNSYPSNPQNGLHAKTGYDVCYDYNGNAWVLGGDLFSDFYVAKYNNAGALLWKYHVPAAALGPYSSNGNMVGDLEVNKTTGTAYVAQGSDVWASLSGAKIYKLNSSGTQTGYFSGDKYCGEISRIRLTCAGKLYGTGGGVQSQGKYQLFSIDTNLTAMTGKHVTTSPNGDHDTNLMTLDPTGNFMYNNFNYPAPGSPDFLHNNEMHKTPLPSIGPAVWINPGPIYHFVELNSIPYAGPLPGAFGGMPCNFNMFNGMVCGNGFLYTYNGDTIKKWDKSTGIKLGEVITGGTVYWSGGLDMDICENVYAGVSNTVKVFDSNLNLINTYPLPDTSCYDLKIDKINNLLYATGVGYVCTIAITPPVLQLTYSVTPTGCGGCNGTASANISCNTTAFEYNWLPGGQTTSSITGLCAGTYTVIATANITCAKIIGDTAIVTIPAGGGIPPSVICNHTDATCSNNDGIGNATVTGGIIPYTYSWSPSGGTNASATGLSAGTYSVLITDAIGCTTSDTVKIALAGGLVVTTNNSTICSGQSATLSASGGTSYSWSTGETTSAIILIPSTSTSYTVTVTDSINGCIGIATPSVTISTPPAALASDVTVCSGQAGTLTATGGGNYLWSNGSTTSTITISPSSSTTYSVIVSSGGCADTAYSSVTVNPSPAVNIGNDQILCQGESITLDAGNTGSSYLWSNGSAEQSIVVSSPGNYWVIEGLNNCLAGDTVKINLAPSVHLPDSSLCTTSPILLDPGSGATSYSWSNGSTSQTIWVDSAGVYSVTVMFGSCVSTAQANITGGEGEGTLYVPNAFTPNNDNLNEIFLAKGTGILTFNMSVFDRWGNLLFTSDDVNKGWDGKVEGGHYILKGDGKETSQEDVYIWKIDYTTHCFPKNPKKMMGSVTMVK